MHPSPLTQKSTHATKHNGEHPKFYLKDINSAVKLASTFFEKMQANIDNESSTGVDVPAFAHVSPVPLILILVKRPHANVGDESTNLCTNQDINTGGLKKPRKSACLELIWVYSTQNPVVTKGYSLGAKENPLATFFACRVEFVIRSASLQVCTCRKLEAVQKG